LIKRRRILLGALGVVATASLGLWGADVFTQSEIASSVRRRLSFLKLDEAGLHAFARDQVASVLAKRPTWYRIKFHIRMMFSKSGPNWGVSTDHRSRREHIVDNLATMYLLSSDFFLNGADESRSVRYVALFDPMRACDNPFARPVVDPAGTS
jgi:hypothetical protein